MINPILQTNGPESNSGNNMKNTSYNRKNSGTKKIILIMIIVLISIIVIGGGIFAYTYFFTDAFLSEEEGFYKYISQNSQILEMFNDEDLDKYTEKIQNQAYSSNGEFSVAFVGDIDEKSKQAIDEIQKHKITFNSNIDKANKYFYNELGLNYGETDVISGAFVQQNDYLGLKVNDIGLNPYIVLENNNLKQFAKNLGLSDEEIANIPDKIDFEKISRQEIFTKEELAGIKDRYLKAITDNLTEDMFSQKEENGMKVYTLTINEEKGKILTAALMNTLKNDDLVLNKFKQLYVEQLSATEEEAQALIDSLKTSLEDAVNELNGISGSNETYQDFSSIQTDTLQPETTEESENLYISVYVSKKDLVKTEVNINNEGKFVINNNDNNVLLEIIDLKDEESNTNHNQVLASIKIEKNKTNNDLSYNFTISVEEKEFVIISLTYTGLKEMSNVESNLLVDIDLSDIIYANNAILNQAQSAQNDVNNSQERESVSLALAELLAKYYEDTYTSETEFEINETTIKQYMDGVNLDTTVSRNEDGTYRVLSNTTGNIYTVDSKGVLTNTEIAENTETEATIEPVGKTLKISLDLNGTTSFGEIQKQELTQSNMYKINDKTLEQIESLFTQLGDRVAKKMSNAYKNSPFNPIIFNTSSN